MLSVCAQFVDLSLSLCYWFAELSCWINSCAYVFLRAAFIADESSCFSPYCCFVVAFYHPKISKHLHYGGLFALSITEKHFNDYHKILSQVQHSKRIYLNARRTLDSKHLTCFIWTIRTYLEKLFWSCQVAVVLIKGIVFFSRCERAG